MFPETFVCQSQAWGVISFLLHEGHLWTSVCGGVKLPVGDDDFITTPGYKHCVLQL